MELHAIGIDLGKTVFHLVGLDSSGKVVVRKRCSRTQLLAYTANLKVQVIGMEACSGAHFLGRALRTQGHDVRLMPAQYHAHRTDGRRDPANGQRERGLPTPHGHPGCRSGHCYSFGCRHRQWRRLSKGERFGGLGGDGSPRVFHGRQTKVARHQQARELVSAEAIRARSTSGDAVSH